MMQEPFHPHREHLVLYDGVCGLCNRMNRFVLLHDKRTLFKFAALQSDIARAILRHFGKATNHLDTFYLVTDYGSDTPQLLSKSRAALALLSNLGIPWRWLSFLKILPNPALDWGYQLIARHRYRLFGHSAGCAVPRPEYRQRFIDDEHVPEAFPRFLTNGKLSGDREAASDI